MHRIVHLASMARSGETLLLRTLAAHPRVHVVHNLSEQDSPEDLQLFRTLASHTAPLISSDHPHVRAAGVASGKVLLLKQGTFAAADGFPGFVLVRNPMSVFASLSRYDTWTSLESLLERARSLVRQKTADPFRGRLRRWLQDIAPDALPLLDGLDRVESFCMFYNLRMRALLESGLSVLAYERFVDSPAESLDWLLDQLGLEPAEGLVEADRQYAPGHTGHGRNDLSRPVDRVSLNRFLSLPRSTRTRVAALTRETWRAFGYRITPDSVEPPEAFSAGRTAEP
ncbi:hypothetical protein [Maioricimonas sp. JC845]|uniref:hypothetical protein n=1 Tax=Maioricimonas sp. JC845 TaxID=3232138 RepID=UPI003458C794